MKKILLIIAIFSLAVQTVPAKTTIKELYKKALPSMVTLYTHKSVLKKGKLVDKGSIGSGVIISEDGMIFTAAHVIADSDLFVEVEFYNGTKGIAEIISSSKISDVALLKLSKVPPNIKSAPLGNSNKSEIGDEIIIIGSPYGISKSLSVGYITGKKHNSDDSNKLENVEFFQTDASINQGNSGGAMFNKKGEVIGIVSSILTKSGGFDGIGFAVTINSAKENVLEKMIPWIGINGTVVAGDLAKALNLPQSIGLLVQSVSKGSSADVAGLQGSKIPALIGHMPINLGGDIILSIMDTQLESLTSFKTIYSKLADTKTGEKIKVKFLRNGKVKEIYFLRSN